MRTWIHEQLAAQGQYLDEYLRDNQLTGETTPGLGPIHVKVLIHRGFNPSELRGGSRVWLGGMCSLFTGDSEHIRRQQVTFQSVDDFYAWMANWYPRLDQIHDTLGVPPGDCQRAVYVVEDSMFARRLAKWTGLDAQELAHAIRSLHEGYGAGVIRRWLENYRYRGQVEVVYTSDLDHDLELALGIWEGEMSQTVSPSDRDRMKVELMYTPVWLRILGLKSGLISEPFHHGGMLPHYHRSNGLGFAGFLPYWTANGSTRLLPYDQVTHRGNWRDFRAEPNWTQVNLAFNGKDPLGKDLEVAQRRALIELGEFYKGRQT